MSGKLLDLAFVPQAPLESVPDLGVLCYPEDVVAGLVSREPDVFSKDSSDFCPSNSNSLDVNGEM